MQRPVGRHMHNIMKSFYYRDRETEARNTFRSETQGYAYVDGTNKNKGRVMRPCLKLEDQDLVIFFMTNLQYYLIAIINCARDYAFK